MTRQVTLHLGVATYDGQTGIATIDAQLENISKHAIYGPITLHVRLINSRLGDIRIINSDNNLDREGAIWDFSSELNGGVLAVGAKSRPKYLQFHIDEHPEALRSGFANALFLEVKAQVFGSAVARGAREGTAKRVASNATRLVLPSHPASMSGPASSGSNATISIKE
jgi:hypothetical protein